LRFTCISDYYDRSKTGLHSDLEIKYVITTAEQLNFIAPILQRENCHPNLPDESRVPEDEWADVLADLKSEIPFEMPMYPFEEGTQIIAEPTRSALRDILHNAIAAECNETAKIRYCALIDTKLGYTTEDTPV
jgi:hypothetical protein